MLDAPGTPLELMAFYRQELARSGWQAQDYRVPGSGFVVPQRELAAFCQSANGPWLSLLVAPQANGPNDVRIQLQPAGGGECGAAPAPVGATPGASPEAVAPPGVTGSSLLPSLEAPASAQPRGSTTNSGPGRLSAETRLESERPPAELQAHYAAQLTALGWRQTASGGDTATAWSTWRLPGEGSWQGLLFVGAWPGQSRHAVYLTVESPTALSGAPSAPRPAAPLPAPGLTSAPPGPATPSGTPIPATPGATPPPSSSTGTRLPQPLPGPGVLHVQAEHLVLAPQGTPRQRRQTDFWFDPATGDARLDSSDGEETRHVRSGLTLVTLFPRERRALVQIAADTGAPFLTSVRDSTRLAGRPGRGPPIR